MTSFGLAQRGRRVSARASLRAETKANLKHALFVLLSFCALYLCFFSPALVSGHILAPGDALLYYLPILYSPRTAWDPMILSGFPTMADPQVMAWYPLAMVFSYIKSFNGFLLSAYVLASCFCYGYLYALTKSRLAAAVAGISYGMCGFMFAHLGHTSIVHAAIWVPLIFWALESLGRDFSPFWLTTGSFAVACCFLGGHPQIFVYVMYLSAAYVVTQAWSVPVGPWRYGLTSILMVLLGVGLTALQLFSTLELAALSVRQHLSFQDFISYALPARQIPMMLFPNIYGGSVLPGATAEYFGASNLAEATGYVGLMPLMLAIIGATSDKRKSLAIFWVGVSLLTFLFALGDATPLARFAYHLPAINKFRCPGRHFIELALAVSVLAGLGVAAILRHEVSVRKTQVATLIISGFFILCIGLFLLYRPDFQQLATTHGISLMSLKPWINTALGVPIIILLATGWGLLYWSRKPHSTYRIGILICFLILDLASFGWFTYWQNSTPTAATLLPPISAQRYGPKLEDSLQRMLPMRGVLGSLDEIMPNISRLWRVPNASGHGVFALTRYCEMASMRTDGGGDFKEEALRFEDQSLNLLAVRYLFMPRGRLVTEGQVQSAWTSPPNWLQTSGFNWPEGDIEVSLGAGCEVVSRGPLKLDLPEPISASAISIVSWMGCSTEIKNGTPVAHIIVTDADNKVSGLDLIAGRDTSEWAYDCEGVHSRIQHQRAPILSSFPAQTGTTPCQGHRYIANLPLRTQTKIKSIDLMWLQNEGVLSIRKLGLINEAAQLSYFLQPGSTGFIDSTRWHHVEDIGSASVYENLQAMPRVWLATEAISMSSEEMLKTIKTSRFPDGSLFEPARTALIGLENKRFAFRSGIRDGNHSAQVVRMSNTSIEVRTDATADSLLVTSDIYYPGWIASLDGKPANLLRTDYTLRGVRVPAGNHLVRFEFRPRIFYYGTVVTAISLLLLFLLWMPSRLRSFAIAKLGKGHLIDNLAQFSGAAKQPLLKS
jgi:Bacterial membrane protein YfhO.